MTRDELGRLVRETWVAWAREQPDPKPHWLVPWEGLGEADKEVDRRIGEAVQEAVVRNIGSQYYNLPPIGDCAPGKRTRPGFVGRRA